MNFALTFPISPPFRGLLRAGARRPSILDARCGHVARGETQRDDAACGNEIAQRLFVRVRNHHAFPTTFGPKGFYHCVVQIRRISSVVHNSPSSLMSMKLDTPRTYANRGPNRCYGISEGAIGTLSQKTGSSPMRSGNEDRHSTRV